MQIVPTLPPAAPATPGAPAPAEPNDGGFAEMLKGESARAPERDEVDAAGSADATEDKDAVDAAGEQPAAADEAALDPALAQWLAGLHMPPPSEPRLAGRPRAAQATDSDAEDGTVPAPGT
ncbi:MAG: hypothetical protein KF788_16890, partial [Piscinibacter sp.]|nr:hypothetical protein [Piscinibacter sp.]